jgi:DNA polymerase-4
MISKGITGRSLTIKIKDTDFRTKSATETTSYYLKKEEEIRCLAFALLKKLWRGEKLRLIGLSLSNLCRNSDDRQLLLFP